MIWVNIFLTITITNIFGLTKKGEYECEYIWFENNGRLQIQIYLDWQNRANANTNTKIQIDIRKYKYKYEYLSHTGDY